MRLFGKKEEEDMISKSRGEWKKYWWLFVLIVGAVIGVIVQQYVIEPLFSNSANQKLSDCRASLNLANQEVAECYKDLKTLQDRNALR